jgi:hypothetical protein
MTIFYEELTYRLPMVLEDLQDDLVLENGTLIPTMADLPPGAQDVQATTIMGLGKAKRLAPGATDVPMVRVKASRTKYPTIMSVAGADIQWAEQRAFEMSGHTMLLDKKLETARRAIAEDLQLFAAYGDVGMGVRGLFNQSTITVDNNSFAPSTATYNELVDFFIDVILRIGTGLSRRTRRATDVAIAPAMMTRLKKVSHPQMPQVSALDSIKSRLQDDTNPALRSVEITEVDELGSSFLEANGVQAGGTNKDRIVVMRKDEKYIHRHIEQTVAEMMPEEFVQVVEGTTRLYPMFSCASATIVEDTEALRYIDLAKL